MRDAGHRRRAPSPAVAHHHRSDPAAGTRPPDLVRRDFTAERPNRLWVTDLTYVPTWSGVAYVCFIVDACSRMIVGWRVAAHMRTDMVLDAFEMACWSRGTRLDGLDRTLRRRQSQFTSDALRRTTRRARRTCPRSASVGDCYDNALAETVNGLYKTELIRGPAQGPWKTVDDVELATSAWVHWHNTDRLHGYLGDASSRSTVIGPRGAVLELDAGPAMVSHVSRHCVDDLATRTGARLPA